MSDDFDNLIKRLTEVYAPPSHLDPKNKDQMKAVVQTYRRASSSFLPISAPVADLAYERITSGHQYWAWPTPGEVSSVFAQLKKEAFDRRIGE